MADSALEVVSTAAMVRVLQDNVRYVWDIVMLDYEPHLPNELIFVEFLVPRRLHARFHCARTTLSVSERFETSLVHTQDAHDVLPSSNLLGDGSIPPL